MKIFLPNPFATRAEGPRLRADSGAAMEGSSSTSPSSPDAMAEALWDRLPSLPCIPIFERAPRTPRPVSPADAAVPRPVDVTPLALAPWPESARPEFPAPSATQEPSSPVTASPRAGIWPNREPVSATSGAGNAQPLQIGSSILDIGHQRALTPRPLLSSPGHPPLHEALNALLRDHGATILNDLGVPTGKDSMIWERTAMSAYNTLDDAFSRRSKKSTGSWALNEFLNTYGEQENAYRPLNSLWDGAEDLDAQVIHMKADGTSTYLAGPEPISFGRVNGVASYLHMLMHTHATAAVALVQAPWWPSLGQRLRHGDVEIHCVGATEKQVPAPSKVGPWAVGRGDAPSAQAGQPNNALLTLKFLQCELRRGDAWHALTVLVFDSWPDFGTLPAKTLAALLHGLDDARAPGPIAVHCGAGRGRTGTLIMAHALASEGPVNSDTEAYQRGVHALLRLRCQRDAMVETPEQFVSALRAAIDYWRH